MCNLKMVSEKIFKLFIAVSFISIPLASYAANTQEKCPSIGAIASINFDSAHISPIYPDKWAVMQTNQKYDMQTELNWDFAMILDAKSQKDAYINAKNSLWLMKMPDGPTHVGDRFLLCEYKMPTGFRAIATYPAGYAYP